MARFDFVRPGGQWSNEMVPGAEDWRRFDVKQSKSVNGDNGGAYAPTAPIVIGGAGLQTSVAGSIVSGGVTTATGGRVVIAASAGDAPTLSPSRSRTIRVSALSARAPSDTAGTPILVLDEVHGAGVTVANGTAIPVLYWPVQDRFMHIGARLASVVMSYVITRKPTFLPTVPMDMAVIVNGDAGTLASTTQVNPFPSGNLHPWAGGYTPGVGEYVVGSVPSTQPRNRLIPGDASSVYFKATTVTGATGGSEPTWPGGPVGTTVTDGGVTWTLTGRAGTVALAGLTTDAYYANGGPQTLGWDFDGTSGLGGNSNIVVAADRWLIAASAFDALNAVLVTGFALTFDTITSMAFE